LHGHSAAALAGRVASWRKWRRVSNVSRLFAARAARSLPQEDGDSGDGDKKNHTHYGRVQLLLQELVHLLPLLFVLRAFANVDAYSF